MASSPASPTSSSDLYPNSEPAGELQTDPIHLQSPDRERTELSFKNLQHGAEKSIILRSSDENTPHGLHKYGYGAIHASSESGTVPGTSNRNPHYGPHKRKREGDPEDLGFVPGNLPSLGLVGNLPSLPYTMSFESSENEYASREPAILADNWSNVKRTKPNDTGSGSPSKSSILYQSSSLTSELWQYIFCFVPPVFLGRLLRVNHAFNAYLTPSDSSEQDVPRKFHSTVKPLSPETIWASSRRRFCPGLPKPMRGLQELDMWRLLRGHDCQICGNSKGSSPILNLENPWESGPGDVGVKVIWPWGIRVCGQCIQKSSEKEVALLFTSVSALLPALPFAFISISNHYIASTTLRSRTPPPTLQLTKCYYKPHIEEIKRRLDLARGLGNASAEEWIKGLDSEGKERLNEITRWEQWEARGGLRKVNLRPHPRAAVTLEPSAIRPNAKKIKSEDVKTDRAKQETGRVENIRNEDLKKVNSQFESLKYGSYSERSTPQGPGILTNSKWESNSPISSTTTLTPHLPPSATVPSQNPWINTFPYSENLPVRQQPLVQQARSEKNIRDVNEAKANRKAEIERRCATLDPPLIPKVLAHMDTFQAAIQIPQPLTDQAWNLLKPRLLNQRVYAERREKEIFEQSQLLQAEYQQRRQQEAQLKETKESLDREWDNVQTPIRNHIARLADERIETKWSGGRFVTKDNSPQFAADVLLYVRQFFYDAIAQEEEATTAISRTPKFDVGPPSRMLILENMKWLFDNKVKPLTENFQKELFLCNGCDGNFKFYGLESIVQHYAAKHTTTLSCGPQVVSWRAEWPEHPLFHPKPSVAQADYYKIPPPLGSLQNPNFKESEVSNRFGIYANPLMQVSSTFSSVPHKDIHPQQQRQNGYQSPFENQNSFRQNLHTTGKPQDFSQTSDFGIGYSGLYTSNDGFRSISASKTGSHQVPVYNHPDSLQVIDSKIPHWHEPESTMMTSSPARPLTSYSQHSGANGDLFGQTNSLYHAQLDELARHARDVWAATSGIKDIPQSVRIFVVIQQMVERFKKTFPNEPTIEMFLDGLDHNVLMRPIRNQKGLACRLCVTNGSGAGGGQNSYTQLAIGDRWLYHLPQLLNHFKASHLDSTQVITDRKTGVESQRPDWKVDMIELPESHLIATLTNASGMDDAKLELIAMVFPGVFPSPLPRVETVANAGPIPIFPTGYDRGRPSQRVMSEAYSDSPSRLEIRGEAHSFNRPYSGSRELSQPARSSEPPGDDEYDPRRPAYIGNIVPSGTNMPHAQKSRNKTAGNNEPSPLRPKHDDYSYVSHSSVDRPSSTYNGELHIRDNAFGSIAKHGHVSEDGEAKDSSKSFNPRERSLSPQEEINAADKFLDNLSLGHALAPPDREIRRPTTRPQELSQNLHPQTQLGPTLESSDWRTNVSRLRQENDLTTIPFRTDSSKGKKYDEPIPKSASNHEHETLYRSKSDIHRPLNESLVSRRSSDIYTTYEPSRKISQGPYEMSEANMEASHSDSAFHVTRTSQYRSRSRSPRPIPIGTTYYRTRTPANEGVVHESLYHMHSPSFREDARPQRIISYDYPIQERYEYFDDRRPPDNAIRQRVEYVPIRVEEHAAMEPGRFVIAQPAGMRPPSDYVRLDRGYNGEPLYPRHGPLYHADPRPYHIPQSHGAPTSAQDYRY